MLRPGYAADIVLIDPDTVGAVAPEVRHDLPGGSPRVVTNARGIERVVVNGTTVLDGGRHTGDLPGRFLRPAEMAAAR